MRWLAYPLLLQDMTDNLNPKVAEERQVLDHLRLFVGRQTITYPEVAQGASPEVADILQHVGVGLLSDILKRSVDREQSAV